MVELVASLRRAPAVTLFGANVLIGECGQVISVPRSGGTPTVVINDETLENSGECLDIDRLLVSESMLVVGAAGRAGHYRVVRVSLETGDREIIGHIQNGTLLGMVSGTAICAQYNSTLCSLPMDGGQRHTIKWNVESRAAVSDAFATYLIDARSRKLLRYATVTKSIDVLLSDVDPDAALAQDETNIFVSTGAVVERLAKNGNPPVTAIYSGKAPRVIAAAADTVFLVDGTVKSISNVGGAPRELAAVDVASAVADGRYLYAAGSKSDGSGVVYRIQYTL